MHLGGALAQQAGELEVGADRVGDLGRDLLRGQVDEARVGHHRRRRILAGQGVLEVPLTSSIVYSQASPSFVTNPCRSPIVTGCRRRR